jgi:DNA-binding MarR family transcriptional regulator
MGGMSTTGTERGNAVAAEVWNLISELMWANKPKFMAVCREFDLFPPQVMVLRALEEPKPMREVAQFLACDNSNLTGIIDRLEERDLVRRTADPKDRRVKLLVLTEEGQRVRAEILERISEPPAELAELSQKDLRTVREILARAS